MYSSLQDVYGKYMHQTVLLINGRNTHLCKYIFHVNVMTNPDCISPTLKSSLVRRQSFTYAIGTVGQNDSKGWKSRSLCGILMLKQKCNFLFSVFDKQKHSVIKLL